ncbi:MAG: LPP20 family lipoprotein [Spirochaetaceae bacterium]|jgi:hypothetical protein|nr:LPP20 family lipoprotein [Spirochaetaceae bacterium]
MMKSFIRVFVLSALLLGTASGLLSAEDAPLEAVFDSGYWVTRPSGSAITVFGVAGRRGNRDEGVRLALLDAARKAALYHGLHGESVAVLNQGAGALDYFSDFDYRLELRRNPEEFLDALIFDRDRNLLEKNGIVLVRVRYTGVSDIPPYNSVLEDGVPDWTKKYVVTIPGFMAGIGYSKNKGSFQKTYEASYENALVSLLPQLSTRVDSNTSDVAGGRSSHNVTRSAGDLTGVMILETWFDRRVNAVWTLVAARAQD